MGRSSNQTKQWLHKVMNVLSGTTQSQIDVVNRENKSLKCHSTPALPKEVGARPGNFLAWLSSRPYPVQVTALLLAAYEQLWTCSLKKFVYLVYFQFLTTTTTKSLYLIYCILLSWTLAWILQTTYTRVHQEKEGNERKNHRNMKITSRPSSQVPQQLTSECQNWLLIKHLTR